MAYLGLRAWNQSFKLRYLESYYRMSVTYLLFTTYSRFLLLFIMGLHWQLSLIYLADLLSTYFIMLRASRLMIERGRVQVTPDEIE